MLHRVAQFHRGIGIDAAERHVLGHPFDEPQRQTRQRGIVHRVAVGFAADVELKGMDQLVADHVIGIGDRSGERQHDAAANWFGDAASAFAQFFGDDVGLFEIDV